MSVETRNFDKRLKRYLKMGKAPAPGYFKDCDFRVTVAYYTRLNPTGYSSRNARAYRNNDDWATTDAAVKSAHSQAGYTFEQVRDIGQAFLNNSI